MKNFRQLRESENCFWNPAVGPLGGDNAVDTADAAIHDITNPEAIRLVNVYLGQAARKGAFNPYDILRILQRKLAIVGLQFVMPSRLMMQKNAYNTGPQRINIPVTHTGIGASWIEVYPLTYLGGRYGVLDHNYTVGKDDNLTHRAGHGLVLKVRFTTNMDKTITVHPEIIPDNVPITEGIVDTYRSHRDKRLATLRGAFAGAGDKGRKEVTYLDKRGKAQKFTSNSSKTKRSGTYKKTIQNFGPSLKSVAKKEKYISKLARRGAIRDTAVDAVAAAPKAIAKGIGKAFKFGAKKAPGALASVKNGTKVAAGFTAKTAKNVYGAARNAFQAAKAKYNSNKNSTAVTSTSSVPAKIASTPQSGKTNRVPGSNNNATFSSFTVGIKDRMSPGKTNTETRPINTKVAVKPKTNVANVPVKFGAFRQRGNPGTPSSGKVYATPAATRKQLPPPPTTKTPKTRQRATNLASAESGNALRTGQTSTPTSNAASTRKKRSSKTTT